MTEDEAFIRSIVDRPGDDLPRLVYADWLDERNDPRGAYLRAEVEWAKTKQTAGFIVLRLNGLAEGLDPVWVARVSRPPVGVCVEHVGFEKRRPPTTQDAITAIETRFNLTLPDDYKAFLLNYNAVWSDSAFYMSFDSARRAYYHPLLYIFSVNSSDGSPHDGPGDAFASTWQLQQLDLPWRLLQIEQGVSWPIWTSPWRQDYIPILCHHEEPDGEAGWLSLGVRGRHLGQVVEFGSGMEEDDPGIAIAPSFAAFIDRRLVDTETAEPEYPTRRRIFE